MTVTYTTYVYPYMCICMRITVIYMYKFTYISLSCLMAVHGGKSLQASGVRNENSYEQPCKPINSGWAFCGKKKEIQKFKSNY